MSGTADVTVVIPTRDRLDVLAQSLRTIIGQRGVQVQIIVVDDGSTADVVAAIAALGAPRAEVLRNDVSLGPSAARNRGIALADTPWVAFCDDDDVWAPDKLAVQLAGLAAADDGARWSCTAALTVGTNLEILGHRRAPDGGDVLAALLGFNVVPGGGSSVVVATDLLTELGGFDESMNRAEDWDLWIRLAMHSPLVAVDRPLVGYRVWPRSESLDTDGMARGHAEIEARYGALAGDRGAAVDELATLKYLAKQQLRAGRRAEAARSFAAMGRRQGLAGWARAAASLAAPELVDRVGNARAARAVPAAWRSEAAVWLADLGAADLPRGVAP